MIILDTALQKRQDEGRPVRVGLVGAGYMGRGIALQIITATFGMQLVAIANRSLNEAQRAFSQAGVEIPKIVGSVHELDANAAKGKSSIT
jgi:predicted homoserine dehydrogenase-like protein